MMLRLGVEAVVVPVAVAAVGPASSGHPVAQAVGRGGGPGRVHAVVRAPVASHRALEVKRWLYHVLHTLLYL